MDKNFVRAFREIIREEIIKKNVVELENLGRFEVVHNKQYQKKLEDGQVVMMPPEDIVVFIPEKTGKNEN